MIIKKKRNLFAIALVGLTIVLPGYCQKDKDNENDNDNPQQNDLPVGALSGKFSVSEDKQVYFSQGNLYWNGSAFKFETNQYDVQNTWSTSHVSHFYWSNTESVARAESYGAGSGSDRDVFFTNDPTDAGIARTDFTVNGVTGKYRTLSKNEWMYLFNTRTVNGGTGAGKSYSLNITYGGMTGLAFYPDDYSGSVLSGTVESLPEGVVFLPASGYRYCSDVADVGVIGYYWSSSASSSSRAYGVSFSSGKASGGDGDVDLSICVRLVTDVK